MLTCGPGDATVTLNMDGVWWQSLGEQDQLVAVQGMVAGFHAGWLGAAKYHPPNKPFPFDTFLDTLSHQPDPSGMTFDTIADHITEAYRDHPALLKVEVSSFLPCAFMADGCELTARKYEKEQSAR